jgi:hypothetical protein
MDKITTHILEAFSAENTLDAELGEDEKFEHLAAYLTIRRHFSRALDTNTVIVGKGGDTGVDAIAIIVNGTLITDVDQVQEMLDQNGYLEATFIFVQAERSASFDGGKIGTIGNGVVDFFSGRPTMDRNQKVQDAAEIMNAVYERSAHLRKRPACRVYYVTTGTWREDKNLVARRDRELSAIKALDMFDHKDVEFTCLGASDVHRLYQDTKNAIARKFVFQNRVEGPRIPGVEVSYLGYIGAKEFALLISDSAGDAILGSIFYDNVRDWQDYNFVNSAMRDTIQSDKQARFVLMNNGITIIAKSLKQTGSNFVIEGFQIVNGCQTSNVIFDQRDKLTDDMMIPLRLIVTSDDDVTESIILATNQQTELKEEQLYARTEFAKNLERYFSSFKELERRLYYERRDGQYDRLPVERGRIVSPQTAIKTFTSMFLNEPHTATKNYKSLRAKVGSDLFAREHKLAPYYVAAFTAYKLELQYRSLKIAAAYKSARYHILLAVRLLLDPQPLPQMNSSNMEKRCEAMMRTLWDQEKTDVLFQKAKTVIDQVSNGKLERDVIRTQNITSNIIKTLERGAPKNS